MISKKSAIIASIAITLSIIGAGVFYILKIQFPAPLATSELSNATVTTIAENLNSPWSVAFYGNTALISSRNTGEIHELLPEGRTKVVTQIESSAHEGEGGLLGLTVNDDFLYAYHTTTEDNRIVRYKIRDESGSLSLIEHETILQGLPSASVHNGGRIAFGPDGMLYATVGDAGDPEAAQDLERLNGKIIRISPDGSIPKDNPFEQSYVYSYGHRNPQGITWSDNGTMYASEFGQNTWDELNLIRARGNYGWPEVEGGSECPWNADCKYAGPLHTWKPSSASPSGIAYAEGTIFIANLRGAVLRAAPVSDAKTETTHFEKELGRIRDVVIAPDGKLWIVTNNTDGRGRPSEHDDRILSVTIASLKQ